MACKARTINEEGKKLKNKKEGFYIEASVGEWTVNRDTSIYYTYYLPVKTNLINNTPKEIDYIDYNCGWTDAYLVDNKNLGIDAGICNHNFPVVNTMLPYSIEKEKTLRILFKSKEEIVKVKFRVGLIYIPFTTYDNVDEDSKKLYIVDSIVYKDKNMPAYHISKNDKGNIIWSDTLTIK